MHGLGQNKDALKFLWPFLTKAGLAVFSIDAQYHGERKPKTPIELFGTAANQTRDMLVQTVIDLRRAVDYLQSRPDIDPNRIGFTGFSMGGILGADFAGADRRVRAPVLALAGGDWKLLAQYSRLPSVVKAREKGGADAARNLAVLDPVDPIRWVAKIEPRPILFINGDHDTIVPVASARALQAAAGPDRVIFTYRGDHVPVGAELPRTVERIVTWLRDKLTQPAPLPASP